MSHLPDFLASQSVLSMLGMLGIGLVGLSALRIAYRDGSFGGRIMAWGAIALLSARLYHILAPSLITREWLAEIGPPGIAALIAVPPLLLSFGLAGVVWGLWMHQRWAKRDASRGKLLAQSRKVPSVTPSLSVTPSRFHKVSACTSPRKSP